jgi:hypothetical protein
MVLVCAHNDIALPPPSLPSSTGTFADLAITALFGVRPQRENKVVIDPSVLAAAGANHFALDHVAYKGHILSVAFDADGTHYRYPASPLGRKGLVVLVDGKVAAHSATIERLDIDLSGDAPWRRM